MDIAVAASSYRWPPPSAMPSARSSEYALTQGETAELAARLLDVSNETDFDHLLRATITHAAARTGNVLSLALGGALGGLLKIIARRSLAGPQPGAALGLELEGLDTLESEYEANLQFVRLAGEAARQAADEFFWLPPDQAARASVAAAAEIYAPPLSQLQIAANEWDSETEAWDELFEYDPEMEYFLGGLIRSVGKAVKSVAKVAGAAATAVSKAGNAVGRIPVLGNVVRAGIGAVRLGLGPTAMMIDAGSRLARGEKLGSAP